MVKEIEADTASEVAAMCLVLEKISIPIPRILKSFVQTGTNAAMFFMEYIDGDPLFRHSSFYYTT